MADLTTLRASLEALKARRRSGVRTVTWAERSSTNMRDAELRDQIASVQAEIDALEGTPRVRNVVVRGGKAW
jgi:hypothetical protein